VRVCACVCVLACVCVRAYVPACLRTSAQTNDLKMKYIKCYDLK